MQLLTTPYGNFWYLRHIPSKTVWLILAPLETWINVDGIIVSTEGNLTDLICNLEFVLEHLFKSTLKVNVAKSTFGLKFLVYKYSRYATPPHYNYPPTNVYLIMILEVHTWQMGKAYWSTCTSSCLSRRNWDPKFVPGVVIFNVHFSCFFTDLFITIIEFPQNRLEYIRLTHAHHSSQECLESQQKSHPK